MSDPTYPLSEPSPDPSSEPSRYEDKPMLRVLECYVLWSIDELPDEDRAALEQMAPKLAAALNARGEWHQVVAQYMEFTPGTPRQIAGVWRTSQSAARRGGETLTPQQFAEGFVDHHLNTHRI